MNTVKIRNARHSVGGLFIFLLIGAFAVFLLLLVLIGAGAYRGMVDSAYRTAQVRTSLSYIANKVRAADQLGGVSIEQWQASQALLIREWRDETWYETYIYYLPNDGDAPGGGLYENFLYSGDEPAGEEDIRIADISALDMRLENGLLSLLLETEDGQTLPLHIRLHAAAR